MRQRFAIPGDEWEDYMMWLCCGPCSLCQETRTLSSNGVEDGVWPSHMGNASCEKQALLGSSPVTPPAVMTPPEAGDKQV